MNGPAIFWRWGKLQKQVCGGGESSFVYLKWEMLIRYLLEAEKAFRKFIPVLKGEIKSGSHWHLCSTKEKAALKTQNLTKANLEHAYLQK